MENPTENKYKRPLILLSGGKGLRMQEKTPKQYLRVSDNKESIIELTLKNIMEWGYIDSILIVADLSYREFIDEIIKRLSFNKKGIKFLGFASPGESRQESLYNGLLSLKDIVSDDSFVTIHDAVRPFVSKEVIERIKESIGKSDGVMPYLPMTDTVYLTGEDGNIKENLDRSRIIAGQTPEVFSFFKYLSANESIGKEGLLKINGSTEPAVLAGLKITPVLGDKGNIKITTKEDLLRL